MESNENLRFKDLFPSLYNAGFRVAKNFGGYLLPKWYKERIIEPVEKCQHCGSKVVLRGLGLKVIPHWICTNPHCNRSVKAKMR